MVSKSRTKMKISISITPAEKEYLDSLVMSGKASSVSHAVRLCIMEMGQKKMKSPILAGITIEPGESE